MLCNRFGRLPPEGPDSFHGLSVQPSKLYAKYIAGTLAKIASSIVFGLFIFVFILAFIGLLAARPESAVKVFEKADITWLLNDTGVGDAIIDGLNSSGLISFNVTADTINRLIKRENVSTQVGRVVEEYARAISEGNYDYYLNSEDIENFIRAIAPDIRVVFNVSLTDYDFNAIAYSVNRAVNLEDYSIGKLLGETGMDSTAPYILLSVYPPIVIGFLIVLMIFDVFLLHRCRIRTAFLFSGIPIALSGLTCFIAGLLLGPYSGLFSNSGFYGVLKMIAGVTNLLILPGLICLGVGIIAITAYVIINKKETRHVLQINSVQSDSKVWRRTGLITNASVLLICSVFSLLFYINIP